ncbi:MAG TPA: CHASE3 domain-containing protein, partial [Candidatus Tumulicola sp.]|nr:CHASE3 domain-containing protein [Candidatus Tumulicola sp.]
MAGFHQLRSIRVPVLGLSVIPLGLLLVVVAAIAWLDLQTVASAAWTQRSADVLSHVNALRNDLSTAQSTVQAYQLAAQPASAVAFESAAGAIPRDAALLQQSVLDNPAQAALARSLADGSAADV